MPANTTKGYPYPLPTDPVAEGAGAIQDLAEAVDTQLGTRASGTVTVNVTTGGTAANATVTFPAGRFTAAPNLVASTGGGNPDVLAASNSPATVTSGIVAAKRATAGPVSVAWIASQT